MRLGGPAHGIVTKTVHKTLPGGGGGPGVGGYRVTGGGGGPGGGSLATPCDPPMTTVDLSLQSCFLTASIES